MSNILDRDIKYLPGIGEKRAALLDKELGIRTFRDMLYTFPYRYIDRSRVYSISEIDSSMAYIQLRGRIIRTSTAGTGKGARFIATLRDDSGTIDLVFFKGVKWIQDKISPNREYIVFGKPYLFNGGWNMVHPELDPVGESGASSWPSTLIGIYSSTDKLRNNGISIKVFARFQQTLQQKIAGAVQETLPQEVLSSQKLPSLAFALANIHFPKDMGGPLLPETALPGICPRQHPFSQGYAEPRGRPLPPQVRGALLPPALPPPAEKCEDERSLRNPLPQGGGGVQLLLQPAALRAYRVIKEIRRDTVSGKQMNRLLQGDVGSGKTMVALLTALIAVDNGYQACVMAPTEVLAVQHMRNFERNLAGSPVRVALLTGSTKAKERREIDAGLRTRSSRTMWSSPASVSWSSTSSTASGWTSGHG